jgi:hypothetical protein
MPCGKVIYQVRQVAIEAIKGNNGSARHGKKWSGKTYFCHECKGWHIHTQGKKKMKKRDESVHNLKTHPDNRGKQSGQGTLRIANYTSKKFG